MASLVKPKDDKKMTMNQILKLVDTAADKINQKAGKVICGRIGKTPEIMDRLKIRFIPTPSMVMNNAIGGGFPRRRCSIISGMPDSGKTSVLLETIAINQKKDPNFFAVWLESESSLEQSYLIDTMHIDPDRFFYMEVRHGQSAEEILDVLYTILQTGIADMVVINSLKCLVPKHEEEASLASATVAEQARMNSRIVKKFRAIVAEYDTAFVIVQHLSSDIMSYGAPLVLSGGKAIQYWSALTLSLSRSKKKFEAKDPLKDGEGAKIYVSVLKNHVLCDRNPYVRFEYYVVYGQGTEQILEALTVAESKGIAAVRGAWVYWYDKNGEEKQKWNGRAAFRKYMLEHKDVWQEFMGQLNGQEEASDMSEEEIAKTIEDDQKLGEAVINLEEMAMSEEEVEEAEKKDS